MITQSDIASTSRESQAGGLIITIVFHALLALIVLTIHFPMPVPQLPEPEGLLIALGEPDMGGPDQERAGGNDASVNAPSDASQTPPDAINTGEDEESPIVHKETPPNPTPNPNPNPTSQTTTPVTNPKPEWQPDNNSGLHRRTRRNPGTGTGNAPGDGTSDGYGTGNRPGNQGDPNGDPLGKPDGTSYGKDGIKKFKLGTRRIAKAPVVNDKSQKSGTVRITIHVNDAGKVTYAKLSLKGSTTTDAYLVKLATDAALKTTFTPGNAPEEEGFMDFEFKLE